MRLRRFVCNLLVILDIKIVVLSFAGNLQGLEWCEFGAS